MKSFRDMPKSDRAGSRGTFIFNILRHLPTGFLSECMTFFMFQQPLCKGSLFPTSSLALITICFLEIRIPTCFLLW